MRLKHVLLICFLVLSALPLILSIWTLHSHSSAQYRKQIASNLDAISELAKQRLLATVDHIDDNATLLANNEAVRRHLVDFARTRAYELYDQMEASLREAEHQMDNIIDVTLFAPNGQFLASVNQRATSFDPKLFLDKERAIFLVHSQELIMRSITRIMRAGVILGFMVVDFDADFILDLVEDRTGLGETGEWLFAVRDAEGHALFAVPLRYDPTASFVRRVPKDRLDVPITQAMLGNEILMDEAPDYQGIPVMASTRYLPSMDWGLVAKINESEIASIISAANRVLELIGIGILVLAIIAAIWLSGVIARPVEQLRRSTLRVIDGDFDVEPIDAGWREAKDLGSSFANMAISLQDLRANLQEKVSERTRELDEVNQQLMELSVRDPLTGVHNRRYVTERLDEEFARSRRYNGQLGVAILDIDHFKKINDTLGHATGDEVLIGLAFCVQNALRSSDLFGRVGGEEFCIVIPEAEHQGVVLLLERIREEIQALPFQFEGKSISVTCSVGVAFLDEEIQSSMTLVECADKALYHAKATGRNKLVVYSDIPKDELEASTPSHIG
ncbi:sensor domain-containing diguanylate cyclase [Thalassospira lucentensis]|uniref:sensor domain-containing diguanylate cyclase n=1 Tax=Thalassospira lucentensis TaxID=168935 RepID=UPI003D2EE011